MPWAFPPSSTAWRQLFEVLRRPPRPRRRPSARDDAFWARDPLSHPVLQDMTQRQLGDLPFDRRRIAEE